MGNQAGRYNQQTLAVAVGFEAGQSNQGSNAVAVGYLAGNPSQQTNSIILNASGANLASDSQSLYVKPIRGVSHGQPVGVMHYDPSSGEITYSTG